MGEIRTVDHHHHIGPGQDREVHRLLHPFERWRDRGHHLAQPHHGGGVQRIEAFQALRAIACPPTPVSECGRPPALFSPAINCAPSASPDGSPHTSIRFIFCFASAGRVRARGFHGFMPMTKSPSRSASAATAALSRIRQRAAPPAQSPPERRWRRHARSQHPPPACRSWHPGWASAP